MCHSSIIRARNQNYCSLILVPLVFIFFCLALVGCEVPGINSNGVGNGNAGNCNGIDNCNTHTNSSSVNSSQQNGSSVNCLGSAKTGGGITQAYSITVDQGCVVIVQGVVGQNVGPYNWNYGA